MLEASGFAVADLVDRVMAEHELRAGGGVGIVAVGGGAGGLGRHVAHLLGLPCVVPPEAEVISSLGDALSLLRAERERTVSTVESEGLRELARAVEAELLAAGAAPGSIEVRVDEEPEKGTVRAVATGAIGLRTGARPGRPAEDDAAVARAAASAGFGPPRRAGRVLAGRGRAREPGAGPRPLRRSGRRGGGRGRLRRAARRAGGRGRPPDPAPGAHHARPDHLGHRREPPARAQLVRRSRHCRRLLPPPLPRWWSVVPTPPDLRAARGPVHLRRPSPKAHHRGRGRRARRRTPGRPRRRSLAGLFDRRRRGRAPARDGSSSSPASTGSTSSTSRPPGGGAGGFRRAPGLGRRRPFHRRRHPWPAGSDAVDLVGRGAERGWRRGGCGDRRRGRRPLPRRSAPPSPTPMLHCAPPPASRRPTQADDRRRLTLRLDVRYP